MKRHSVLQRALWAAGTCLLPIGILIISLVWAAGLSLSRTAEAAPAIVEAVPPVAPASTGSRSAAVDPRDAGRAISEAWEKARDAGAYSFATSLAQVIYPARALSSIGRGPEQAELHLAGTIDQSARTLEFRLRQPGMDGASDAVTPGSAAEARIEGDRAYVRPDGGEWQEVEDFSANFAPDNDPLAFLAGIKDAADCGLQSRASAAGIASPAAADSEPGLTASAQVACYRFNMDGPVLAGYLRDRLERQLAERGELPLGVALDSSREFREMTGDGELWVDGRGLPLRLAMHLVFPEQRDGSHLDVDIQTDFSGFPEETAAAPGLTEDPVAWAGAALGLDDPSLPDRAAKAGSFVGTVAGSLAVTAVLLFHRRSRRLYTAVVIAVTLSMVIVPLMQSAQAMAFFERQDARSRDLSSLGADGQVLDRESAQEDAAAQAAIADSLAPTWDPHRDPLAQAEQPAQMSDPGLLAGVPELHSGTLFAPEESPLSLQVTSEPPPGELNCDQDNTADPDGDGVNNFEECVYFVNSGNPDTDGDVLTDSQELNKLGTDPNDPDTDGDVITDTIEVRGFVYPAGGRHWYLDPNNADSNNDSMIDSAECPALVQVINPSPTIIAEQCDSDRDGVPNPFDTDNDNDGVPDAVDLSPDESVDINGKRAGQAGATTAFNSDRPFMLSLSNLQPDWPVFVDLQLRPVVPNRLAYAMNVLDWPAGDVDGQIQHGKGTTFATSDNPDIRNPKDTTGANGDLRLVPLLEIMMTGNHLPLALTSPAATATVRGEISATVKLTPNASNSDTVLAFTFSQPGPYDVEIYDSACPVSGSAAQTFTGVSSGALKTYAGKQLVDLADGQHAMLVSSGALDACANIPDVVNGPYTDKMVDMSVLEPYGITVQDQGDGSVLAYVPLNVTSDDTGGGKTAFQARMLYWPGQLNPWVEAQQMKVVWLVQMVTDSCSEDVKSWEQFETEYKASHPNAEDPEIEEAYNTYFDDFCAANRTMDQIIPVHVYDESWYLTGLSVREDHGLDVAVSYINPSLATYDDDPLYTLSLGLGEQFMTGLDCETDDTVLNGNDPDPNDDDPDSCVNDEKRDLAVSFNDHLGKAVGNSTIEQRFDITSTVPITQRWGIAQNALKVESFPYDHQDYLAYHSMTQTPRILGYYTHEVSPTLLLAREERFRAARLEAASMPAGGALTVDVNSVDYPERTLAGLQWTPYRYNSDMGDWEATPPTEYWDILEVELKARFYELYPNDDAETNMGRVATARAYSFALINSLATTVVHCTPEKLLCPVPKAMSPYSDDMLIKAGKDFVNGLGAVTVKVIFQTIDSRKSFRTASLMMDFDRNGQYTTLDDILDDPGWGWVERTHPEEGFFKSLGQQLLSYITTPWKTVFTSGPKVRVAGGIVVGAAVAAVIATVVVSAVFGAEGGQIAAMVIRSISVLIATHCAIAAISSAVKAANTFKGFMAVTRANLGFRANLTKAGVISTVIQVLVTWGAFVALFYSNDMVAGSMTFDSALAGAIADTITAVVLFVILTALGPLGAIVSAIIGLINAIANLICSALPEKAQTSKVGTVLCRGITGIISSLFKRWIYAGTILVELEPEGYDRLSLYNFNTTLVDEELGLVAGAEMRYSVNLTNTIDLVRVPFNSHELFWSGQFNDENLKKANFDYKWQDEEEAFHDGLSLGGMTDRWLATADKHRFYVNDPVPSEAIPLPAAGINRTLEGLVLSEAYALPEQECWGLRRLSICAISTEKSTNHFDIGSSIIYDILPATLDGFYELTPKGDGRALAWGQEGDLTFPTLYDADGDGLPPTDDPDDGKWDADGDGLSDPFELQNGSDPLLRDSDDDGLTDQQEGRFGSNPGSPDSDGDGLYDCQEVFHQIEVVGDSNAQDECGQAVGSWTGGWDFVYGGAGSDRSITRVTANPADVDSDGDGLTDQQELIYGYNPGATSNLNVLSLSSQLGERISGVDQPSDSFVAPGQTLSYSATVKNELDNRQAEGLLWTEASDVLDISGVVPQYFNLWPQTQANMTGTLQVLPGASGSYSLTQVAGALIADLSAESDDAALWLRFDDPPGSTTYLDTSGRFPAHDGNCVGSGCVLDTAGGRTGGALKLNGSSYVEAPLNVSETAYALALWFKTTCADCGIFSVDSGIRGAGGHDRHLYLSGGNVCARVYSDETRCTSGTNYADSQWHHLVHTFGGNEGGQKIYLDGVLKVSGAKAASNFTTQDGINIGFSNDAAVDYFTGSIDDLRLFDDALTQGEVQALANLPLFHMDFDQSGTWTDVSSFKTPVSTCVDCPTRVSGISGGGAHFEWSRYLSVPAAQHLNLSGGRLTLSAWIYPRLYTGYADVDTYNTYNQGILGLRAGGNDAYPTLQRVGRKLLFGLGAASGGYRTQSTTNDVLTVNQWNHVAVTLDKDAGGENLRFYVNGELVEKFSFPVTNIAPTVSFEIGRSDPYASVKMLWYSVDDNGDDTIFKPKVEMCATVGGQEVWNQTMEEDTTAYPTFNITFRDRTTLVIFEDDGGTRCGSGRDDNDDTCSMDFNNQLVLDTDAVSYSDRYEIRDCGTGGFAQQYTNNSIPFHGDIDEVQVFGQPLDEDAIRQLYLDHVTLMHLPLDEAPGARAFEDASLAHVAASCAGSLCPSSGTTGRINQAAWFDRQNRTAIQLGTSPASELVNSFTVAAWINPRSLPDWQRIVAVAGIPTNYDGWGFGLAGRELLFTHYGVKDYKTSGLALEPNRWIHVAAVVSPANEINFYVDGALWQTLPGAGVGHKNTDDTLLVGAMSGSYSTDLTQVFDGQIDDVWIFNAALPAASIQRLYLSAPRLHLLFDEAYGAAHFADNAAYGRFGTCTAPACPATGEGVPGQIGLAAQFDGGDDFVDGSNLNPPNLDGDFTLTQWFTLDELGAASASRDWAAPVGKGAFNAAAGWAVLVNRDVSDDALHRINLYLNGVVAATIPAPTGGWAPGRWYQYAFTRNGGTVKGYLNGGEKTSSTATPVSVANSDPLLLGKDQTGHYFWQGKLDDLRFYVQALTAGQIRDLYLYQSAWVEDRQPHNITVDSDAPSATVLITDSTYLANQAIWVGITADDPTSDVDKVELGVQKGSGTVTWSTAARCLENLNQPKGAWCAQFAPWGEGRYTLYARATDRVGNTGSAGAGVKVYVDDTAPTLAVDQLTDQLLNAVESEGRSQTWVVHLSGTVADPPLVSGQAGSGVPADGVHVTLRGAGGEALGDDGQTATISGTAWSLDYEIGKAEPDGCYELEVEAADQVARIPGLVPAQVAWHTKVVTSPVVVRASAPAVLLNQQEAIAGGQLGPGVTLLGGETTHRPVPVEVDLTATTGADQTRVWLSCQHGNEGSWYTPFDVITGTLTAGSIEVWEEELHHWSSCQITATTTATPAGGVSGVVKVCGTQIAQWSGDFAASTTVPFTVHSDSCFVPGCAADSSPPVSGVQGVDLAFRSVLPGSAFSNETPPAGEILHLPFEDTPDSSGQLLLRNVSGIGPNGTCTGSACPIPGQASPSGSAALFDGQDDAAIVAQVAGQGTTDYLTIAAWVYPTSAATDAFNRGTFLSRYGRWEVAVLRDGTIRWAFNNTNPGWGWHNTGYKAPLYQWTHIVVVYDAGQIRTYANGVLKETYAGSGSISNANALNVGGVPAFGEWFAGALDEVRLFTRVLPVNEIQALYTGTGPLLALSFEKPWATDGASLPDASGWEHHATLKSGANDAENKAAAGQVGSYALKLDGVNDYANAGDSPDLKLTNSGTIAAWIYPTVAKDMPILNREGEYEVYRYADGTIRWAFANTTPGWTFVNTEYVAQPDTWTHIAVVYDAGIVQTYANGALVDTYAGAGTIGDTWTSQNELWVGGRSSQAAARFGGSLDDVRIYQRALPARDIADLYHAGWQAATLTQSASGVERSSWTAAVPGGLEGSYQVEMRGRDVAGHVEAVNEPSLLWRGEADNLPPRMTVNATSVSASTYRYTAVAEDYHLVETDFNSPCGPSVVTTRETFRSPWYLGMSGDTQKLYRLTAVCDLVNYTGAVQATACDSFGNCSTCDLSGNCSTTVGLTAAAGSPQAMEGPAVAAARVPAASKGAPAAKPGPAGFEISAAAVVTSSHYYEPQTIDITGQVTSQRKPGAGQHDLASVQVAIADYAGAAILSEPAAKRPYTTTWTLPWRLASASALPDGVSYTAAITATDLAGRTTSVNHSLTADVVLPAPVTMSLTGNGRPVEPGAIIRETPVDLALTWTASSDGSGLGPYEAAWRFEDAYTTTIQTSLHDPAGPREANITAGEAQRISAGLASQDIYGNERWQVFGSVIVDGPFTPDYISLIPGEEGDITGGACALLGVDGRITILSSSGRWTEQRLYGTWDHQALRLTWTGGHWDGDGDLFIYLDTGPTSTTTTFAPYAAANGSTPVTLPESLGADTLVWVQDQNTAGLLRWDGSAWVFETSLSPGQLRFDGGRNGGQTDLYLPFELLGTSAGASLGLLAFAAEEPVEGEGLQVWATAPRANPVNSSQVNNRLAFALALRPMVMNHAYRWDSLGDGVCPNGIYGVLPQRHNDAVLEMAVESDPPGGALSGVVGGLFWVSDPGEDLATATRELLLGLLHPAHQPLPDGQQIAYTVRYRNEGSHAMVGASLDLLAHGALRLSVGTIELGDIPPGGEGSVTFQGTVDRSLSPLGLAAVGGRLYDAANGREGPPLEWLVAAHRVDRDVPEILGLSTPDVMGTRAGWLSGRAHDESGVSQVEIEITSPSGAVSTLTCEVPEQASGRWSCPWDATAVNGGVKPADGDAFTLRLRATDRHGYTSDWSAPRTIRVDAQPPTVTLAEEVTGASPVRLVRGNSLRLTGDALDNHAVGTVTVCLDDACRTADLGAPGASASWWSRWMVAHGALDYVAKTLTIRATDDLGNSLVEPLSLPVVFDNVPPVLVTSQALSQAPVGSKQTVLNGTVSDGGPDVKVSVRLQSPDGTEVKRMDAARDGGAWWFDLPADMPGQYTLWVDAEDLAGNVTTAGPYTVDVDCTDAAPVVTSLTAEPVAGWPMSLTLTVVISNAGPESLPAGIPVDLSDGSTYIGPVSTSVPLNSGESQALSLVWAPTGARNYDIGLTAGQNAVLPNGPLCVTPGTAYFSVPVRDQVLHYRWNLISPRVNPSNTDVEIVQRGIDGAYSAILSYDGEPLAYYPDRPQDSTLTTVDALHGYWIQTILPPTATLTETVDESAATWRMSGEILPEDQPLPLASGWNLAGYLPARALTVTTALEGIAGRYGAVLGFEYTALSYYPDLDQSYNTLVHMAPGFGYWISATEVATLQYPVTGITNTVPMTATQMARERLNSIHMAEWQAGVLPTTEWMNYYGELILADGAAVPVGTVILAVDPQGTICGATAVWQAGQYGLLACYRDDPATPADEGATPGDLIELYVSPDGTQPDGQAIGAGIWTAHGERWEVGEEESGKLGDAVTRRRGGAGRR